MARRAAQALLTAVWRAALPGMSPRLTGDAYLDACPAPLQSDAIAAVPNAIPVRPVLFDGPMVALPPWLATLARPAAYVTLGTMPVFSTPALLRTILAAISPIVAGVVVTTGPNPVSALGDLPPHVHAAAYLPQSLVLPQVDLVISHAGSGGTFGALLHGLPHLAVPLGGQSQETAAERVEALGIGLRISAADLTPARLRAAAERLLRDTGYRRRAEALRRDLEQRPDPARVVALLTERYGAGPFPPGT